MAKTPWSSLMFLASQYSVASCSLVDHSVLFEGSGTVHKLSMMDANSEAFSMIRHYGSMFLRHGDLQVTV